MVEERTGSDEEPRGSCVLCGLREPRWLPACDLCRNRLAQRLWELRDLHALLPAALAPGQGEKQRISGSREAPLPLRVAALDLAAEARAGSVRDQLVPKVRTWWHPASEVCDVKDCGVVDDGQQPTRRWPLAQRRIWHREVVTDGDGSADLVGAHDQDGALSVAAVLDSWVRDWAEDLGVPLPDASVPALVSWLSVNLRWAVDNHPAIVDFHQEVTVTLYALRTLLNVSRKPIYLTEACPRCNVTALKRDPGGGDVQCGNCRESWKHEQFERLAVVLADDEHAA